MHFPHYLAELPMSSRVRPNTAVISVRSVDTLSSLQPFRFISLRQVMSFAHSFEVVRNTRSSATFSQASGYGFDVIPVIYILACSRSSTSTPARQRMRYGGAVSRVLFIRSKPDGRSSIWGADHSTSQAVYPRLKRPGPGLAAYLALLQPEVTVPRPVAGRAVGSYPTFSPLPNESGRYFFCGPYRRLSAPRSYLAACPTELGLSSTGTKPVATVTPHLPQPPSKICN